MAIELITGRYGTAHIGSEDVRAYQAYTAGSGRYVLHGGGASIQSANDIHVNPAEILIDGAHVRITGTGEDVTIDNGASSYKRVDIIALHYKMTGDGDTAVESVTLDVVKGTPADSDPQDPDMPATGSILDNVSETYVPYVRVLIDGLTPQTPEAMLPSYAHPIDRGGTGLNDSPSMLVDLGSTAADDVLKASPRPGVTGTLPVARGGTGMTSNPSMLTNLGSTAAASVLQASPRPGVTGTLPVSHGGTGANTRASAMLNLAFLGGNITGGTANDTREFWQDKGTGYAYFSSTGMLNGQPGQYGYLINIVYGYDVRQLWLTQSSGILAHRGANGQVSTMGGFTTVYDSSNLLNKVYPVGAVYISYVSTSPASLFGGSWTAITGRFPYFNAGTGTGGSNTHTHGTSNLRALIGAINSNAGNIAYKAEGAVSGQSYTMAVWDAGIGQAGTYTNVNHSTKVTGTTDSASTMPSYQTFYAWRRTA